MPMSKTEEALVFAAKNGNTKCFEELYKLYYEKIYALALTVTKNASDAEDVLQITFVKAWQNIDKLDNPSAFNTWLQRITINQCKSMLRGSKQNFSIDDEGENGELLQIESDLMLPEQYAERADLSKRLKGIIDDLSVVQRETILLYYFNDMSIEEIAQTMDCSEGTVKSRLYLARKAIKTEIEEQEKKTGEKFYGIAGVALVPFAGMFIKQIKSASLSGSEALNILNRISNTLFNTPLNPANLAQLSDKATNAVQNTTAQPTQQIANSPVSSANTSPGVTANAASAAAKTGFPLWTKIVAIVAGIGLIAGGGVVAWNMLKPGKTSFDNKEPTSLVEGTVKSQQVTTYESTTEKSKTIYDIDPSELPENLTEFLQVFDFAYFSENMEREFKCDEADKIYDSFVKRIVGNPTMVDLKLYPGGNSKSSFESNSDPLNKYPNGWGYIAVPKEKTIWIMKNVFNIPESKIDGMIKAAMQNDPDLYEYEENGTVFLYNKIGGVGGPGYDISFETVRYDGEKYYFVYDCSDAVQYDGAKTVTYYAEMELKKTDGLEYWSLYRHTENIPALPEPTNEDKVDVFKMFAGSYTFTSGVGYWSTQLELKADGTFTGQYHDQNAGESGNGYDGTTYVSTFSGRFINPKKINSYTYSFELSEIKYDKTPGTEEINAMGNSDYKMRTVYSEAYGLKGAKTIYAYTEDAPVSKLPEGFTSWVEHLRNKETKNNTKLSYKCLYAVEPECGWIGSPQ